VLVVPGLGTDAEADGIICATAGEAGATGMTIVGGARPIFSAAAHTEDAPVNRDDDLVRQPAPSK
jgi:hypothetical protein